MKPRQQTPAALLARIRGRDFASSSDAELRDAFTRLQSQAGDTAADDLLPAAFAIVAEAIDRRLGVWRLFDDDSVPGAVRGETDGADAWVIAETAADVSRQRKFRRAGEILLPAGFYQAARRQDADGRLRFHATDEQLLAGIALFRGKVAQMDAGEGKTVAAAFPAALHALMGRPVHVVTANDYLADRDAKLLEPVYHSLGLSVGAVLQHTEEGERRHVYRRAIVYGPMRELGFDFLRDNLKTDPAEWVQRPCPPYISPLWGGEERGAVAIVDEADHALIDEAFTPMIISGNPTGSSRAAIRADRAVAEMMRWQHRVARELAAELDEPGAKPGGQARLLARLLLAQPENPELQRRFTSHRRSLKQAWALAEQDYDSLTSELYYAVHPGNRFVTLTGKGREFVEQRLGTIYDGDAPAAKPGLTLTESRRRKGRAARRLSRQYGLGNQVLQSLRAHLLLKRDVDYLVDGDGVALIDPHTGRPKPDNIYQHGLQAAVEAKEGVTVRPESETLAWISVAGFVSRYRQVCGITGTAAPAAGEFRRKYGLEVAVIPPVNPPMRSTRSPKVFLTRQDKLAAVADEIVSRHRMGQPVLAATRTVEQSEELSRELARRDVSHRLLNAVTTHAEARIVRDAGAFGAVTVSTQMAGRGTDIILEPGLNARLAQRCAAEICRMLAEEAGAVDVTCPSPEQAAALRAELERSGLFHTAPVIPASSVIPAAPVIPAKARTGGGLRVTLRVGGEGGVIRGLEFALGLCVIGTEIYDSRRIELQLHGRSGRQGEFGLTQTFLSLEDLLVSLDAEGILKLSGCRQTDAAGRVCYTGPEVARRIERLQAAADREGEAQRSLMQDYAAEFDRQTHLYYQRRQDVILSGVEGLSTAKNPASMTNLCREIAERVASRLAAQHLGREADDDYPRRFGRMAEEARLDYGVDCSSLYGTDLTLLPAELSALFVARLYQQASILSLANPPIPSPSGGGLGWGRLQRLARLLWLQICGELWPGHIAGLRDSMSCQLLSNLGHKSAVAQYVRRSNEAWREYWELVDAEFISRLAAFPLSPPKEAPTVAVSRETELLLGQEVSPRQGP